MELRKMLSKRNAFIDFFQENKEKFVVRIRAQKLPNQIS